MSEDLSARLGCGVICLQGHDEIHAFVENKDNRLAMNYFKVPPKVHIKGSVSLGCTES